MDKRSNTERILIALVFICLALIPLLICAALAIGTTQIYRENQATRAILALTPSATPTVTPTRPPTFTPRPTLTPEPSSTTSLARQPLATSNQAREEYLNIIRVQGENLAAALESLGELLADPRLLDNEWRFAVGFNAGLITGTHDIVSRQTPPADLRGFHQDFTAMTRSCSNSAEQLTKGIDTVDEGRLKAAGLMVVDCRDRIKRLAEDYEGGLR